MRQGMSPFSLISDGVVEETTQRDELASLARRCDHCMTSLDKITSGQGCRPKRTMRRADLLHQGSSQMFHINRLSFVCNKDVCMYKSMKTLAKRCQSSDMTDYLPRPKDVSFVLNASCGFCGTLKARAILKKCNGCKSVYYCDVKCQKRAWPGHKKTCKERQKELKQRKRELRSRQIARDPDVGDKAKVRGLENRPEYNGWVVRVVGVQPNGNFLVENIFQGEEKRLSIKPKHLVLAKKKKRQNYESTE